MADSAAHLVEHVLPEVPVRQWVFTLPYPLRYRCAWDAQLTSEVLRAFLRALFADQRRRARKLHGVRRGHCGSVAEDGVRRKGELNSRHFSKEHDTWPPTAWRYADRRDWEFPHEVDFLRRVFGCLQADVGPLVAVTE